MRPIAALVRRWIGAPRWPSRDHRDYQSVGALAARRARRLPPEPELPAREPPPRESQLPPLAAVVRTRREHALLHVELVARCAIVDGRPPVLTRDGAARTPAAPHRGGLAGADGEAQTWTVTLRLN